MTLTNLWFFLMGAVGMLIFQYVLLLPFSRRHKVVMALLDRAKMYQQRAVKFAEEGKDEAAMAAFKEYKNLVTQAQELHERNKKK